MTPSNIFSLSHADLRSCDAWTRKYVALVSLVVTGLSSTCCEGRDFIHLWCSSLNLFSVVYHTREPEFGSSKMAQKPRLTFPHTVQQKGIPQIYPSAVCFIFSASSPEPPSCLWNLPEKPSFTSWHFNNWPLCGFLAQAKLWMFSWLHCGGAASRPTVCKSISSVPVCSFQFTWNHNKVKKMER